MVHTISPGNNYFLFIITRLSKVSALKHLDKDFLFFNKSDLIETFCFRECKYTDPHK